MTAGGILFTSIGVGSVPGLPHARPTTGDDVAVVPDGETVPGLDATAPTTDPSSAPDLDADAPSSAPTSPPEQALPITPRRYTVQPGDSVRTIASQFGVTNETIIWQNDLTDPDTLIVGQTLEILPFSGLIHEVRPGDTVASIANAYDAKVDDVISTNHLTDPYIIVVGQKLAVPGGYRPLPQKIVAAPPEAPAPGAAPQSVQAPASSSDQQAATLSSHALPVLGNTPQEQFIASIAQAAVDSAHQTGVPASVTIAQAILESYWGSSRLSQEANNYFGIKALTQAGPAGTVWYNVWEVIGGRSVMESQPFRAYHSMAESFVDHGLFFVQNGRYAGAMAVKDDARAFARAITQAGYATDPTYGSKLIQLMDRYNLYRYDDV